MKRGFFLNVVVGESTTILQLLSRKDQALLVRGNPLLILDLGLDIVDGVRGLDFKGDGFACKGLDDCKMLVLHKEQFSDTETYRSAYRHEDGGPGGELTPFGYYNPRGYGRLPAACQQR